MLTGHVILWRSAIIRCIHQVVWIGASCKYVSCNDIRPDRATYLCMSNFLMRRGTIEHLGTGWSAWLQIGCETFYRGNYIMAIYGLCALCIGIWWCMSTGQWSLYLSVLHLFRGSKMSIHPVIDVSIASFCSHPVRCFRYVQVAVGGQASWTASLAWSIDRYLFLSGLHWHVYFKC